MKKISSTGKFIRGIRLEKSISLNQMANETGLAKGYIKSLEAGEVIPSVGILLQIARVLGIDSRQLLKTEEDASEERSKAYTRRTEHYAYTSLTPGAENKHLKAFRIVVDARKRHGGVGFQHEGEEFVHVLDGEVEIQVGDHVNLLKKGDSLHFNSGIKHDLRNVGKADAELIVVVFVP